MVKKCPFGECEDCTWNRHFQYTNHETGEVKVEPKCGLDVILGELLKIIPNLNGVQQAAEEGRNAVWGMAAGMAAHGMTAPMQALQTKTGERIMKSLEAPEEEEVEAIEIEE